MRKDVTTRYRTRGRQIRQTFFKPLMYGATDDLPDGFRRRRSSKHSSSSWVGLNLRSVIFSRCSQHTSQCDPYLVRHQDGDVLSVAKHPSSAAVLGNVSEARTNTYELFSDFCETRQELIQFLRPRSARSRRSSGGLAYLLSFAQLATTRKVGTEESHHAIDDQQLVRAIIDESVKGES